MWWHRSGGRWSACSGREVGDFIRALHEEQGVVFHLEDTVAAIGRRVTSQLKSGRTLPAELVVVGVGVRPRTALAERAGLKVERGVDRRTNISKPARREFSPPATSRAGLIHARASTLRIEHWVVAERQGQVVARNMLGQQQRFSDVPFFWSQHYDVPINYVGHAEKWDKVEIDGDLKARDCLVRYRNRDGEVLAVASIYRDLENLTGSAGDGGKPRSPALVKVMGIAELNPSYCTVVQSGFRRRA